jgi:Spy/CpxP family protein refolding chaperone
MGIKVRLLLFAGIIIAVAAISCCVTLWCIQVWHSRHDGDAHMRIHTQLGLTHEQEEKLHRFEERYEEERGHWVEKIREANMELADAIREDGQYSPRVETAVQRTQEGQRELKNVVLRHVFEMREVLNPEQYQKLLKLTAEALEEHQGAQPGH